MPYDIPHDRAFVDQIVDGRIALLLIGPHEHPHHVPVTMLPAGIQTGTWVVLEIEYRVVAVDTEMTNQRTEALDQRLSEIRKRQRGGRFTHND